MNKSGADIYLALLHNQIYNKLGEKITTTVTNYDLHDISRAAKTYDVKKYFVVNQLQSQQELVQRVKDYWTGGRGADYCYNRHEAFSMLEIADDMAEVKKKIEEESGKKAVVAATDASKFPNSTSYAEMRNIISSSDRPILIIFGTGYGLSEETLNDCDIILKPVLGRGDFNHLSVRSAASIIMDRLLALPWWEE